MADNFKFSRHKELLGRTEYACYDNYEAIDVPYTDAIPSDYEGAMGVPISFLDKYCPEQFDIIGLDRYVEDNPHYGHRFTIGGKETFARILIRHKCLQGSPRESYSADNFTYSSKPINNTNL